MTSLVTNHSCQPLKGLSTRRVAADAVESHLKSAGTAIDDAMKTLLNDCRKTAAKADEAESAVGRLIDTLGQKMEHLGMAMQKHS